MSKSFVQIPPRDARQHMCERRKLGVACKPQLRSGGDVVERELRLRDSTAKGVAATVEVGGKISGHAQTFAEVTSRRQIESIEFETIIETGCRRRKVATANSRI